VDRSTLTRKIKEIALALGFDGVGVAKARKLPHELLFPWLERGYQGQMGYLARAPERRLDPELVLPGVKSILSLRIHYSPHGPGTTDPSRGIVARYAAGRDYHDVLLPRLRTLLDRICQLAPGTAGRAYTDTGPVLEKSWAQSAGIGWVGKHTNLIAGKAGSYFFLAELLLTVELDPDPPATDHCGNCTRCIEACPTQAIVAPYVLDGSRCIAYLNIELRDDLPVQLRSLLGNRIFGCDICQEVCPWNRRPAPCREPEFFPAPIDDRLISLAQLSQDGFSRTFAGSAVKRARRRGLLRSVAIALGHWGSEEARNALDHLRRDPDPQVARHAAWAAERLPAARSRSEDGTPPSG
jgi:epoxyqueuosine reductase